MRSPKITIQIFFLIALLTGVLYHISAQEPYEGLTFYSSGSSAYLYDMDKNLVHEWKSTYNAAATAHLLRDSSVLYSGRDLNGWTGGVLQGGRFQIIKWNGDLAWDFRYSSSDYCPHHNMEIMYYTDDPNEVPNVMAALYVNETGVSRPDKLVEIKPTGLTTGEVVWEWYSWEHRTNDPDNHPELLDQSSSGGMGDWTHVNNISWNRELDQLVVDIKSFLEIIIIDHSTTTQEAAGSTGGTYGKGGDILYRWGQASNYGISGSDDLRGFHGGAWVHTVCPRTFEELPGGGNVIIFHNDQDELLEIELPGAGDGIYPRDPGEAFGPDSPVWTSDQNLAGHEGSVQKLPNGNVLYGDPTAGIVEITSDGDVVWSLSTRCNQARRYSYSYLDQSVGVTEKPVSYKKDLSFYIHYDPQNSHAKILFNNPVNNAQVTIFTINGKKVFSNNCIEKHLYWNIKNQPCGIYIVQVKIGNESISKFFNLVK